jgi:hypothetical protein
MSAIGKRIEITPVERIKNLMQTIGTSGKVRHDERAFGAGSIAGPDFKTGITHGIEPPKFQALDKTARRLLGLEAAKEKFKAGTGAFGLNDNALAGIGYPTRKAKVRREKADKRAETDPLDGAARGNFQARYRWCLHAILSNDSGFCKKIKSKQWNNQFPTSWRPCQFSLQELP